MADILNLRRFRKAKARAEASLKADANRIAFGRTRAERNETAARNAQADRLLDGHRRPAKGAGAGD